MTHYITQGKPHQKQRLEEAAEAGDRFRWTVNEHARIGDHVAFYLTAPIGALVATGVVSSEPEFQDTGKWAGHFMADIDELTMLPRDLLREELVSMFPEWGYMKMPMQCRKVPVEIVPELAKLFDAVAEVDGDDEFSDIQLGSHVEFRSKTQDELMTGMVKEIADDEKTVVILRDEDLKKERITIEQLAALLV